MASIECECGNRLSNSEAPNTIQYHVFSDYDWDRILLKDIIETKYLPKPANDVWKCDKCSRIFVFDEQGHILKVYRLDEEYFG